MEQQLYVDEPCVASMFFGEVGWFLQYYQAHMRWLKHKKYKNHKFIIMTDVHFHPFIEDFVSYTIPLPDEFYKLGLDRDCNESVLPNSLPGSLTPPNAYMNLLKYIRNFYNKDKAVEYLPPRGCNDFFNKSPQVFYKYKKDIAQYEKPVIVVMPRKRCRASNRNVPEFVWYDLVKKLEHTFLVVLAGTPNGACLGDYKPNDENSIINLINYDKEDKVDLTLQYLNSAICSVSSQSGGTHISLLADIPAYIIGHERDRHTIHLNRFNTPTSFRYVSDYRAIDSDTIISDLRVFINALMEEGWVKDSINRPSLRTLKNCKDLVGVEIGVDAGLNALNMLENLDIKKLYLIDPYDIYRGLTNKGCNITKERCVELEKEAYERLEKYKDKIVWIKKLSEDAINDIPDNLDFIYIDGNHRYEYVKRDLEFYYPKVKRGGLVACHDYDYVEVQKAVSDFFEGLRVKYQYSRCSDNFNRYDAWYIKPKGHNKIISDDIIKLRELL